MPQSNKNVFQIFIQDESEGVFPLSVQECVSTVATYKNGYHHSVLRNADLEEIIGANLPPQVLKAYKKIKPYAYKADLARYCLLYLYGGWYMDAYVTLREPLPYANGVDHVVFRDAPTPGNPSWDVQNAVIYSVQGSAILAAAINKAVENIQKEFYGVNSLCPTGPNLFGQVLASFGPSEKNITGMYMPLTPAHSSKNYAFVLPDGRILAWGKKSAGSQQRITEPGMNDYNHYYANRDVYDRSVDI
jgi:mannosyltransferase OCH1-like enzyme